MRLGIAMLFVAGCGRFGFGSLPDDDGGVAATDLVVSIVDGDRLAGGPTIAAPDDLPAGTVGLSLREALVIAANRAGPDLIQFDRAMFPVTPAVTIAVASSRFATIQRSMHTLPAWSSRRHRRIRARS